MAEEATSFRQTLIGDLEMIVDPMKQADLLWKHPYVDVRAEMIESVLYYDGLLSWPKFAAEFASAELSSMASFCEQARQRGADDWPSIVSAASRLLTELRSARSA